MISFENDYGTGAHPRLLRRLAETNGEPQPGYGEDAYCRSAAEKIRAACGCPEAAVRFLVGGTQTNQLVCAALLRSTQGVLSAATGHIGTHEAGAIERTGHKVLTLPAHAGKLDAGELRAWLESYYADPNREHVVAPGLVYVSQPTEYGTLYSKAELEAVAAVCRAFRLPLYLDGARLGCALTSPDNDLSLPELAALCDVFYIGGTKQGALCGEALVFPKGDAPADLTALIKQHGGLLAKGRLLGLQFEELFTEGLYFELGEHANAMAKKLRALLHEKGIPFYLETPTNQQFVILEDARLRELTKSVRLSVWDKADETHTVARLCTSWSTTEEDLTALGELL